MFSRFEFFFKKLKPRKELDLILECNGYDNHVNYNQVLEVKRESFLNPCDSVSSSN